MRFGPEPELRSPILPRREGCPGSSEFYSPSQLQQFFFQLCNLAE